MAKKNTSRSKKSTLIHESAQQKQIEESLLSFNLEGEYQDNILDLDAEQDGLQFEFEFDDGFDFDGGFVFEAEVE